MPSFHSLSSSSKRQKFYFALGTIAFFAFLFAANHTNTDSYLEGQSREPASLLPHKNRVMKTALAKHKGFKLHQKISPPINIQINKPKGEIEAGESFRLVATVSSTVNTENVEIAWNLPKFVEIVAGDVESVIQNLPAGVEKTVEVTVTSHSEENQQIHVMAKAPYGEYVWSASDQYNTTMEEEIATAKEKLVKRNKDYLNKIEN